MNKSKYRGHCYCGSIQFEIVGEPIWTCYCHCESCRRHTASVVTTYAGFHLDQVKFTHAQPAHHFSEDGVKRMFCGECGSPISCQMKRALDEGEIYLYLGIFDEPEKLRPQNHVFYRERIPWLNIEDDLPRDEGLARPD